MMNFVFIVQGIMAVGLAVLAIAVAVKYKR